MRAMPRAAAALALVLLASVAPAAVSIADPAPSADDVAQAQAAVASAATAVAQIELELAVQQADLDAAWTAVGAAGEAYVQATVDRDEAQATSRDAAAQLDRAQAQQEAARSDLGAIALEAYRSGASMDGVSALMSADDLTDYLARSTAIDKLGQRAEQAVQRFEAAQIVASTLEVRAEAAAAEAQDAAGRAEAALESAKAAQAAAEAKVTDVSARRTALIAELAARRNTSIEIERARQDALDAERAARADAAARAAHANASAGATPTSTSVPAAPAPTTSTPTTSTPTTAAPATPAPSTPAAPSTTPTPTATPTPTPTPTATTPAPDAYGLGTGSQRGSAAQGQAAVNWAVAQVGKAYVWGATGPESFDCSGLTSQAWKAAGVSISRTSRDQYRTVRKVSYDSMRPGDLIFWGSNTADPSSITHVTMYIGGGQMVEAARPGVPVRVTSIRWSGTMPYAGRP